MTARVLAPQGGRRFAFAHALIREVLYHDLFPSARVALHRRVGEALERLYPSSRDEHLDELAFHFARVAPVAEAGHARAAGSFAERARLNVTRAIRSAIERVGEGHADLGAHLSASVRTGMLCSYMPGTDAPRWEL